MNKKTKRKYWIAAIIWFVTMILANSINEYFHASPLIRGITVGFWVVAAYSINEYFHASPLIRGITVGFWVVAAYLLFKDLMQPRIGRNKDEEEEDE